jgi:DNA-binding GntR family transcriptional regulator
MDERRAVGSSPKLVPKLGYKQYPRAVPFRFHPSATARLDAALPASERAYRTVLDAIASGTAPASSLLSEGEVAAALGMSRTPVRSAFARLAGDGLLELHPKRGAVVLAMGDTEARDVLEARLMVETAAVGWMSRRGVPATLAGELERSLAAQAAAFDDPLAFAWADRSLHEAVVAAAGNAVASDLFARTGPRLLCLMHRIGTGASDVRRRLAAEHARLAEFALAADVDGYAALLAEHVVGGAGVR